jgi:hypothetical protein
LRCGKGEFMGKWFPCWVVLPILVLGGAAAPASAQFQWPPELLAAPTERVPAPVESEPVPPAEPSTTSSIPPAKKPPTPAGPAVVGHWRGELTQIGGKSPYKVELGITPTGAETKYPDLHCRGKLIRIGASKSYAFYIEVISEGGSTKGGNCPDGTVTMARAGEKLVLLWFGDIGGNMIIAHGTLSK